MTNEIRSQVTNNLKDEFAEKETKAKSKTAQKWTVKTENQNNSYYRKNNWSYDSNQSYNSSNKSHSTRPNYNSSYNNQNRNQYNQNKNNKNNYNNSNNYQSNETENNNVLAICVTATEVVLVSEASATSSQTHQLRDTV